MKFLWYALGHAFPLILNGNEDVWGRIGYTMLLTVEASATALVLGLPIGLIIGLGRFRGRGILNVLANAGLALPPALVGATLFVLSIRGAPLSSFNLIWTKQGIYVAQSILALPYVVALSAAAFRSLPPGLLDQARLLGAGRLQVAGLALREARRGVLTATIAAVGTCLSEVAAIAILGGNIYGYDQTLASGVLYDANGGRYTEGIALAIVLAVIILLLMGLLGFLQQSESGTKVRLRATTTAR